MYHNCFKLTKKERKKIYNMYDSEWSREKKNVREINKYFSMLGILQKYIVIL